MMNYRQAVEIVLAGRAAARRSRMKFELDGWKLDSLGLDMRKIEDAADRIEAAKAAILSELDEVR